MCGALPPVAYITSWLEQAIIFLIFHEKECLLKLHVRIQVTTMQKASCFIVFPSTAPLSHREPALARTSRDACRDQDTDKRNELNLDEMVQFRGLL